MTGDEFLRRLDAIEGQLLDTVEYHSKLIALIVQYIKDVEEEWNPCDADSVTSSPDSTSPVSGQTYSVLPSDASVSKC